MSEHYVRGMSAWINQIFEAGQANKGGVVRRNRDWVDKYGGLDELIGAAHKRGFHVIESGDQVIVLCNEGGVNIHR